MILPHHFEFGDAAGRRCVLHLAIGNHRGEESRMGCANRYALGYMIPITGIRKKVFHSRKR